MKRKSWTLVHYAMWAHHFNDKMNKLKMIINWFECIGGKHVILFLEHFHSQNGFARIALFLFLFRSGVRLTFALTIFQVPTLWCTASETTLLHCLFSFPQFLECFLLITQIDSFGWKSVCGMRISKGEQKGFRIIFQYDAVLTDLPMFGLRVSCLLSENLCDEQIDLTAKISMKLKSVQRSFYIYEDVLIVDNME